MKLKHVWNYQGNVYSEIFVWQIKDPYIAQLESQEKLTEEEEKEEEDGKYHGHKNVCKHWISDFEGQLFLGFIYKYKAFMIIHLYLQRSNSLR